MSRRETESEHGLVTETQKKVKRPPLYKVLLHNDDYTTKEFVVQVLQYVFHKEQTEAVQIMLHVHKKGIGVAGVYTYEVAEKKEAKARRHEYVSLEHLLYALLRDKDGKAAILACGGDIEKLNKALEEFLAARMETLPQGRD